jgi:hypothetical protein
VNVNPVNPECAAAASFLVNFPRKWEVFRAAIACEYQTENRNQAISERCHHARRARALRILLIVMQGKAGVDSATVRKNKIT